MNKDRKHMPLNECLAALKILRTKATLEAKFKALKAKGYTNTVKEMPAPFYFKALEARLARRVGEKPRPKRKAMPKPKAAP